MMEVFKALGVIRVLLGVEALTADGLKSLGRRSSPEQNLSAILRLRLGGIVTSFNSLIVHPDATPESISAELDALAGIKGSHFDALAISVNPGTEIWRRLWHARELSGGMLSWKYACSDPMVARFRAILVRLRLMGMGRYGAGVLAHDVALNAALSRHFSNRPHDQAIDENLLRILDDMNIRRLEIWRAALDLASTPMPDGERVSETDRLTRRLRETMEEATGKLLRFQSALEERSRVLPGPSRFFFGSAMASTFFVCGTLALGCYQGTSNSYQQDASDTEEMGVDDGGSEAQPDPDMRDPDADEAEDGMDDETCTTEERENDAGRLWDGISSSGCPCDENDPATTYGLVIDERGRVVDVRRLDGGTVPDDVRACYLEALSGEIFPCLEGNDFWQICHICIL
jgi:hypothetical protein